MKKCEYLNITHLLDITEKVISNIHDTKCNDASEVKCPQGCEYEWCSLVSRITGDFLNLISLRRYIDLSQHISDFWAFGRIGPAPFHIAVCSEKEYDRVFGILADFSKQYNSIYAEKYCTKLDKTTIDALDDGENILFNTFARAMTMGDKMDAIFETMANDPNNINKAFEYGDNDPDLAEMEKPDIIRAVFFETMNAFILDVPFVGMGDHPTLNLAASIQNALIVKSLVDKALYDYSASETEDFSPFGLQAIKACESIIGESEIKSINQRVEEISQHNQGNDISL